MKTKIISLSITLLMGVSVWADDVWNYNVYDDCSKNGYQTGYVPAPADVQAVDLGLPSGLKWASCNVGAEKPEDYGNYYAWGEVVPKEDYSWATYKYANGTSLEDLKLTKYWTDGKNTLDPEDDAAYVNWGGDWRMPTAAEMDELLENCTWTWTTQNGVNGYQVASKTNGNSIFLPAAGCRDDAGRGDAGNDGNYIWSSSLDLYHNDYRAWDFRFNSYEARTRGNSRSRGQSVRPVCQSISTQSLSKNQFITITLYIDGCESAYTILCDAGQQINITAVPDAHRHFVRWTDGNTDNPRLVTVNETMVLIAEFAPIVSGQCGDNLYWKYEGHTLTISGTGNMYNYNDYDMPWLLFRDTTDAVVLEQGITHIGNNAFNGFVKVGKIELPSTLTSIGANAFAGCRKLYDIYSYAVEPPVADNTSFANYNVYLHVPCDNLRDYQMDAVFGSFKYIQCIGAENTTTDGTVTVTPSDNEAVFVWRADESAASYNLEIRKDNVVFCTLVFNASGQLTNIAFAPSRNGHPRHAAEQTGDGFRFTVTGLSKSTHYTFDMTVKDADNATLQTYRGEFNTTGVATSLDNATTDTGAQKIIRDGQVLILRSDKTYTPMGVEVNL